ncbi:MAG: hypothetical protein NVS9B14_23250 [Candidatus Acidiferrum sp.]
MNFSSFATRALLIPAVFLIGSVATITSAEPSLHFNEKSKLFFLNDGKISYIFGINEQNGLQHVYWGKHIEREADFSAVHTTDEWASFDVGTTRTPQEYPGWGAGLYVEPSQH